MKRNSQSITKEIFIIAKNYVNPIPEGHTQASRAIVNSILTSGLRPRIISLGHPLSKNDVHFFKRRDDLYIGYDLLKYTPLLKTLRVDFLFWKVFDFLRAMTTAFLLENCRILCLLNVPANIYYVPAKLILKLRRRDAKIVSYIFHSVDLGITRIEHKFCDILLCANRREYQYFSSIAPGFKSYHVPYPVNTKRFQPRGKYQARKLLKLPLNTQIIGYIGNITPERGLFDLVKAFSSLAYNRKDVSLLIVTPAIYSSNNKKDSHVKLTTLIEGANLKDKVRIMSKIIPVDLFYNAVDVLALPFRQPYLPTDPPVTIVEALSSGTPLITTPVGAIKEVVNKERGLLVEPGNTDMLKDALEYLLSDEKARRRLGLNAREYVVKNLSLEVIGQRMKKIFDEIFADNRP